MKTHAMTREHVAIARHQQRAGRQLSAPGQSLVAIPHHVDLVEPVVERAGSGRILATHKRGKRVEPGSCGTCSWRSAARDVYRHFAGRQIAQPRPGLLQARKSDAVQAFTQYRLKRIFPARFDFDVLPQMARGGESVRFEPPLHVFAARDAILNLR